MSDSAPAIEVTITGAVAHVRFDRPAVRNAFDDHVAAELAATMNELGAREDLRAIVLGGKGDVFCAGGDLNWMRRVADYTREENLADAEAFQQAFEAVDACPLPVVGRIQGAALGGGAGLVACCDIAVAAEGTVLGFPEARLGLVPGVISPYVLRKIGLSQTRRYFLTGQRFDAEEAQRIGLVHVVAAPEYLDEVVDDVVAQLLECAPQALANAKTLLRGLVDADHGDATRLARDAITDARASDDGREGLGAFLAKRKARWRP
ncbi:MAG: enoyl-CoA hydratase-related protein [Planctomycetota bacterium]|nr:enoyl-CoA hydratase-related protein [Planctomycetota bacterium]